MGHSILIYFASMHYTPRSKVVIVGDCGVGKSSIIIRFTQNVFTENIPLTVGLELVNKTIKVDGVDIVVDIADTAGQERHRTLTSSHYRYVDGVIIVYDVTNRESFESLQWWLGEVKNHSSATVQIVLVAHKVDESERVISKEEGENFAERNKLKHFECSAKESLNIDSPFLYVVSKALETQKLLSENEETLSIRRSRSGKRKKRNSERFLKNIIQIISPRDNR